MTSASAAGAEVVRSDVEVRILVVDDEPEIAMLTAEALRDADPSWYVESETDPQQALAKLSEEPFDCLVTDLMMPGMDGLDLARRARETSEDLGLVAISGRGTLENSVEALRVGFTDYLSKPFDLKNLSQAVCRTVRRRRDQQTLERRFAELAQASARHEASEAQLSQKLQIAGHDLVLSSKRMARQMEDVAASANVARSLMGVIELEDLLGLCAELIGDRVTCQTSTVALYEVQEAAIGLMVRARPDEEDPPALCWLRSPLRSGILCRAAETGKSVHVEAITESVLVHGDEKALWQEGRLLVVPIPARGHALGVAVLHRPADAEDFGVQDIKDVTELAKVMGPAIMTAKMHHHQRCQIYAALESITEAIETRDPYLKGHSLRVLAYAQQIAPAIDLTQPQIGALQISARLHDLGRIIIPEFVVNHPGPLTPDQWEIVRRHSEAGANFLKTLDFFGEVADIVRAHHESYDGTGYPDMRAGEEIPVVARLLAIADAFDAMTSPRPYRAVMSIDDALEQIRRLGGQQFDLRMAEALLAVPRETLQQIQTSHR
jgi:response regulator RpfG family c-di-GMP phosphodiesterase